VTPNKENPLRRKTVLVVGAHALAAHGVPRVTGDLDVWRVNEDDFSKPDQVVQFGLPPYRIDFLTSISGLAFREAWKGRSESTRFEIPVAFLGRMT
jgi:hypothetical protein